MTLLYIYILLLRGLKMRRYTLTIGLFDKDTKRQKFSHEIERKISEFENRLHILELSYKKVLIAKVSGTKISSSGDITMDYELMVELNHKPTSMHGMTFQEKVQV